MDRSADVVVILLKQVPDASCDDRLGSGGRLDRSGAGELNPWCRRALRAGIDAARAMGWRSVAVTMGPSRAAEVLQEALAAGVDEVLLVADPRLAGSDALATAQVLATVVRARGGIRLVFAGLRSVDGSTGVVPEMVGALLGLPHVGPMLTTKITDTVVIGTVQDDEGERTVRVELPAVLSMAERACEPVKVPREQWPPLPSRTRISAPEPFGAWGIASRTRVERVTPVVRRRRPVMLRAPVGDAVTALVELLDPRLRMPLSGNAMPLSEGGGDSSASVAEVLGPGTASGVSGRVPGVTTSPSEPSIFVLAAHPSEESTRRLLGLAAELGVALGRAVTLVTPGQVEGAAWTWGADATLELSDDDVIGVSHAVAAYLNHECEPIVLAEAGPWETTVVARLAAALDAGVLTDLTEVRVDATTGRLVGSKPAGGGIADVSTTSPIQLLTVRSAHLAALLPRPRWADENLSAKASTMTQGRTLEVRRDGRLTVTPALAEPTRADIETADVVVGLGRGVALASYPAVRHLAARLGAPLAATRPVTDARWLPHGRQVGVTARAIAPRLYLAIGISGSARHLCGVARAEVIVAVNCDPHAPIFSDCDIGIVADAEEFVAALEAALDARAGDRGAPFELQLKGRTLA